MKAAGLQKNSLIDYPGKLSSVIFLSGCNFTCPYCHNPDLARGNYPQSLHLGQLVSFLNQRKRLLDGVVITGGEPTLHDDLALWCCTFKEMGYSIKLDTNGSRPDVLARLIQDKQIDFIAMDIKTALENYAPPLCQKTARAKVAQSIDLVLSSQLAYEFRTTCVAPFVDEKQMVHMAAAIKGARQYTLQAYQSVPVLDAAYFEDRPPGLPKADIKQLQQIAAPFVQSCTIR